MVLLWKKPEEKINEYKCLPRATFLLDMISLNFLMPNLVVKNLPTIKRWSLQLIASLICSTIFTVNNVSKLLGLRKVHRDKAKLHC